MMTWTTAVIDQVCGCCGGTIKRGAPMLRSRAREPRCRVCGVRLAGTEPGELPPPAPAVLSDDRPLQPFVTRLRAQLFDAKRAQAGDDDA